MRTLVVISILALLTISGAAYTDQLMISAQQARRERIEAAFLKFWNTLGDDDDAFGGSISQIDKPSSRGGGVSDCIADFGNRDFPSRAGANRQPVTAVPPAFWGEEVPVRTVEGDALRGLYGGAVGPGLETISFSVSAADNSLLALSLRK